MQAPQVSCRRPWLSVMSIDVGQASNKMEEVYESGCLKLLPRGFARDLLGILKMLFLHRTGFEASFILP